MMASLLLTLTLTHPDSELETRALEEEAVEEPLGYG